MTQVRTDRLRELADIIEAGEPRANIQGFAMDEFFQADGCSSVGCIAGWMCAVYDPVFWRIWKREEGLPDGMTMQERAGPLLGLNTNQAEALFLGWWSAKHALEDITRHEAAAELRRLAAEHGAKTPHG